MFCTKCGKELHEGDIFCAYCGNKVRAQAAFENNMGRYSEVVFNPPFKVEAQRRTEEITREVKQYSQEPRRESLQFDWNLDGFPGTGKRKDEDFKFNWDDVLEKKRDSREIEVEKILFVTEEKKPEEPKEDKEAVPVIEPKEETPFEELFADKSKNNKPLSIEELEKELFGEAPSSEEKKEDPDSTRLYEVPKDKFYTYNAKNDAFQDLLDKERERVQQMEAERKEQWKEFTLSEEQLEKKPNEALSFEEVFKEPKIFTGDMLREVAVVLPPLTPTVMAWEEPVADEEPVAEAATEIKEEVTPFQEESFDAGQKTKLRYSDIFPIEDLNADHGGNDSDSHDSVEGKIKSSEEKKIKDETKDELKDGTEAKVYEVSEKPKKKNPVLKFIITLLVILVVTEVAIIGVKLIAPESGFAQKVDQLTSKILTVFAGNEEDKTTGDFIDGVKSNVANINAVEASDELKYDTTKAYAFAGIMVSEEFENSPWIENSDGTVITYGQGIVEGLVAYYDQLKSSGNMARGLEGINKLEIGEIRTGETGYFVLCKVTYTGENGETVKYESVYLEVGSQLINVKEVKEETL